MDFYSNKTVLITGATGLIGSHIVDNLMKKNAKVIAMSRNESKLKNGFKEYINNPNFQYIAQDVSNPFSFDYDVDIIFHAAGPMEGKIISNYPTEVIFPNIIGTKNCLEYIKKQNEQKNKSCRLVLFSSVTVYGNDKDIDKTVSEDQTNYTADNLESPKACYSESKRLSEVLAHAYNKQFNCDIVIARFSTVYGNTRFIPDTAFFEFIRKAKNHEDIILNGSGYAPRDNIYIEDAVNGILLVAEKGNTNEAYNISSNGDLGNYAAIDTIAKTIVEVSNDLYEHNIKVISKESPAKPGLKLNNDKLKQLKWEIKTSLKDGIKKVLTEFNG